MHLVAWRRPLRGAIVTYWIAMILTVALYLHHATENLPLSLQRLPETSMSPRFAATLNALAVYAIALMLLGTFYLQVALGELPCPLCLLQRIALVALGSEQSPAATR